MVDPGNYKQLFDSLITAVLVLDSDLTLFHLNISAEMLFGVSSQQMLGKPMLQCFSRANGMPETLQLALDEQRNFTKRQERWVLHNQQEITVDYTVSPSLETGKVVVEIQSVDRLMRISREEAMLSSQAVSRNLVRGMAHEIKNPLGGIRGAAQLLAKELVDQGLEDYTRIIIDETDRLRNLVDRMLGPRTASTWTNINIHEILEHVAAVIQAEVAGAIEIIKDYDPSIPELPADKEQLIQAALNIVRNAMQALQESDSLQNGEIVLRTRIQRRFTIGGKQYPLVVRVSIIDNGPGIPAEIVDDIFFPLVTGRAVGSGLGLAIAQDLVARHGGLIECLSETGHTEFSIYLPLEMNAPLKGALYAEV